MSRRRIDAILFEPGTSTDIFGAAVRGRESLAEGCYGGHSPEWAEFLMEPEEAEELDRDHVLVRVLVRARGARSGAEISHR